MHLCIIFALEGHDVGKFRAVYLRYTEHAYSKVSFGLVPAITPKRRFKVQGNQILRQWVVGLDAASSKDSGHSGEEESGDGWRA